MHYIVYYVKLIFKIYRVNFKMSFTKSSDFVTEKFKCSTMGIYHTRTIKNNSVKLNNCQQ